MNKRVCFLFVSLLLIISVFAAGPSAPTNVKAKAISDSEINLTWNNVTAAKTYSVYRSIKSTGTFSFVKSGIKKLSYLDSDLDQDTEYFYRLTSSNSSGESAKSSAVSATTFITPPKLPKDFTAVPATKNRISLFWTKTFGLKYTIFRSTTSNGEYVQAKTNITADSYVDTGLSPDTEYFYKIQAYNPNEESGLSAAIHAKTLDAEPEPIQQIQNVPEPTVQQPIEAQQEVIPQQTQLPEVQQPEPVKTNILLYLIPALVLVVIISVILLSKIKSKRIDPSVLQVRNYIYDNLRRGHTKEQIINILKQHGHSQNDIDKALKYL